MYLLLAFIFVFLLFIYLCVSFLTKDDVCTVTYQIRLKAIKILNSDSEVAKSILVEQLLSNHSKKELDLILDNIIKSYL